VSDEDASDLSATSRARGIWRTTRHTDKRAALHGSRPPADQSGKRMAKLNGEAARHPRSSSARMSGVSARMLRGNCFRGI